ncbi:MAG: MFS transporter [Promethearchaeota archaeon]|nr:MAG: MFS transporter [Candidatus Lokiarchaeota archaeon]
MENDCERVIHQKKARGFLFAILFANFFRNLGVSIVDIGLPQFVLSLAGSLTSYGIIIGVFSITQAIFQFPMATASDRFGRKRMISIGLSIYIFGTFLCYLAQNLIQLIIFRAIQGAGAYSSILQAMIGDYYRKEQGKGMSLYSFSLLIGYFGGIIIGGYISYYLGFRTIFLISSILGMVSITLILIFLKDPKNILIDFNSNEEKNINKLKLKASDIKILLNEKKFKIGVLINTIRWFLFSGVIAYLIWVLQIYFGLNQIETSYLLILVVSVFTTFVVISGELVDNFGSIRITLIGQIIIINFGFLFLIVSFTGSLILFLIATIFSGIGFALYQTSANAYLLKVIEETNSDLKGTGFGFNNAIGFFFGALGPMIICYSGEFNIFIPYYFIAILVSISFVLTLKYLKN